jgi:protocatechuate 3,4-dioxygenase beta subunit
MVRKVSIILSILAMAAFTANAATVSGVVTDTAGVPLAGAIVTVEAIFGGGALADTTDATGDYSIAGVTAGAHAITAELTGYTAYAADVDVPAGTPIVTRNITLTPLPAGITISGSVTDSATGNPLTGAIVRLSTIGGGATVVDSAIVSATGTYSLTHVQAATYNLSATAAGHTAQTIRVVVAAAPLTRNFLLVALPAGIVISGTVADSVSGAALVGATVTLRTGAGVGGGAVVATATTIAGGAYTIDSVQPGTYSLTATDAGYTAKALAGIAVTNANLTRNFLLVTLPPGITISGTVVDSATGNPLAGAVVELRTGGAVVDSAIVSATGTYSITNVQPGTYNLNASAAGHVTKTDAGIVVAAANLTRNFELARTPGIAITGRVADTATGDALPGAIVRALQNGVVIDSAIVATNGTYALDVPAGTYTLTANDAGYGTKTITGVVVAAALEEDFFLKAGGTGVVTLANNKSAKPEFVMTAGHILQLRNFNDEGVVSVYGLSGKLVYRTTFAAHTSSLALPSSITRTSGMLLVNISQRNAVYRKQIMVP